ncbi:MAG: Ig-like domain-containing protein [Nannocystaceae bacterium]|nr:Ig-like domain-containing protein [Nannocystaceae bacterium]
MTARRTILASASVAAELRARFGIATLGALLGSAACTDKAPDPAPPPAAASEEAAAPVELDLWSGVPPLEPHPGDVATQIVPRPGPEKPATAHETIEVAFPPELPATASKPAVVTGPLTVERFGPTGPQDLVDAIRVTFNQPMVPLASVEALASKAVPFSIDPMPPGKARWLGTRTVAYYPDGRLPFSTTYKVTVPAGTKSEPGNALSKAVSWTLSTPTLALESSVPWGGMGEVELEPTVTLTFNQPVQRTALLAALEWTGGGDTVAFTELEPEGAATMEPWQRSRIVALRPKAKLRPNTTYTLALPAGVFGEGPDRSGRLSTTFSTYPPLTLSKSPCYGPCYAGNGISLTSSTTLSDPKLEEKVHVSPAVENLDVQSWGSGIQINGDFLGDTSYSVTVDAGLLDSHGQSLAKTFKTSIKLGPHYPEVSLARAPRSPLVIEKGASKTVDLRIAGITRLELEGRALPLDEAARFLDVYSYDSNWGWPADRAKATFSKGFDVSASRRKKQTFEVQLESILGKESMGWFIARSNVIKEDSWTWRAGLSQLVEVTDLGLAAALDADSATLQVTRLSDGTPIEGVALTLANANEIGKPRWEGKTDANGLAQATFSESGWGGPLVLLAEHEGDHALMRLDQADLRGQWRYGVATEDTDRAFFFTDRAPYKPGDTIHLVGILRKESHGPSGSVQWWRNNSSGNYRVSDPRGVEVAKGEVKVGAMGTFAVDIPTKDEGGTGTYQFVLEMPNLLGPAETFYHGIPVETYRTPEFTVKVERPDSKPLVFGDELFAEIQGEYLHGAPLVGGEVSYTLTRSETDFRPPGSENDAFTFGAGNLYSWGRRHWGEYGGWGWSNPSVQLKTATGRLDAKGKLGVRHKVVAKEPPPPPVPGVSAPAMPAPVVPAEGGEPEPLPRAATYAIAAVVTDENRQAIAGSGSFVVHPANVYVGLRSSRSVLREGEATELESILVDLEGKRHSGTSIQLDFVRRETTRTAVEKDGHWQFDYKTVEIAAGACALTSDAAPQSCSVTPDKAGTYVARASAKDAKGNQARSEITLYVHGKDEVIWDDSEDRRIDIVADKRKYAPGDTAKILLRSPFTEARGIVVVEREGVAQQYPVVVEGGAHALEIPITASMVGGVSVSALLTRGRVTIAGAPAGQDLGMPAAAAGQLELDVSTDSKAIVVELEPHAREVEPKASLSLTIRTKAKDSGQALPAAVAVMVVDEGVLSLMDYKTPDPVAFFHYRHAGGVWLQALHANLVPRDDLPVTPAATLGLVGTGRGGGGAGDGTIGLGGIGAIGHGSGPGTGSGFGAAKPAPPMATAAPAPMEEKAKADAPSRSRRASSEAEAADVTSGFDVQAAMAQKVSLRTVFATTAFFDADIETDANGEARIDIPMPENLTTFRIMAVAVDPSTADRFGSGESSVRVRKSVMIRPSLPRFANFGDSFEGSVMVDNQTSEAQKILVGTRGLNVKLTGESETFVDVPAGESREVRFAMATQAVGKMRLQFAAMSNKGRDATEITIPVHYPATAKAFADYGMTDESVQRTIEPPADALADFGGLELAFSSTALSGLEDAVSYLVDYPYECAEQTASRILPIFALGDILDAFPIATIKDTALRKQLANDGIARLWTHQLYDGGFGYWRADESWPYLTAWATFALLEGKRQGYEVDKDKLDRALQYLDNFVQYGYRSRWGDYYDWTTRAFGLWLLSGEKRGSALFDTVWRHRSDMPLYARVLLMSAAHRYGRTAERDVILDELRDGVVESARTIHFAESRSEAASDGLRLLMHSDVQTDAIAMMALLEIDPADTRLSKIMAAIMDDRDPKRGGRWLSTHANAWALVAASRYFEVVEKDEPDFTARVWIDELFAGEQAFKGRSMSSTTQTVPMSTLQGADSRQLTIGKDGVGKLYYRVGLRYAPVSLKLPAEDQGFTVYRTYEALPGPDGKVDPDAVKQTEDGEWIVKAGTNVKVTINLVVSDRANYVVVDDALPGGFEGQNPKFVTSVAAMSSSSSAGGGYYRGDGWWWGWWWSFSHTDLRDDRMLLFADQLPAGVYTHSYTARATTIGSFLLPPVKAEEMYEPERFGHSASSRVTVVQ